MGYNESVTASAGHGSCRVIPKICRGTGTASLRFGSAGILSAGRAPSSSPGSRTTAAVRTCSEKPPCDRATIEQGPSGPRGLGRTAT